MSFGKEERAGGAAGVDIVVTCVADDEMEWCADDCECEMKAKLVGCRDWQGGYVLRTTERPAI